MALALENETFNWLISDCRNTSMPNAPPKIEQNEPMHWDVSIRVVMLRTKDELSLASHTTPPLSLHIHPTGIEPPPEHFGFEHVIVTFSEDTLWSDEPNNDSIPRAPPPMNEPKTLTDKLLITTFEIWL